MISNPCKFAINGNETKEFTYEGGNTLYHFSPCDSGLSKTNIMIFMVMKVVFFADSVKHAENILKRMLEFKLEYIECHEIYKKSEWTSRKDEQVAKIKNLLTNQEKWICTEAPTNQFYLVC